VGALADQADGGESARGTEDTEESDGERCEAL
jgi:hypothetical protein